MRPAAVGAFGSVSGVASCAIGTVAAPTTTRAQSGSTTGSARGAPRETHAQSPTASSGKQGEQVALGDRAHEDGGEQPDLDDEEHRVGRARSRRRRAGRDPCRGGTAPSTRGRPMRARWRRGRGRRRRTRARRPLAAARRRRPSPRRRRVRAEQPPGRELPAGGEHGDDDEPGRRSGERAEPEERPEARAIARRDGVDDGGEEERRQEHERLQTDGRGGGRPRDEDAVPPHRRLLERPRQHEERHRDHGQRQRLRHEEPGVMEHGGGEHERSGGDGPPRRRDPTRPEVGRHRDERHRERLQEPRPLDAVGEIERRERGADQRRRQQAVVRGRKAPQRQGAVRPEPLAEHPVDHLVGRDPRRRERLRGGEASRGGHDDQRRRTASAVREMRRGRGGADCGRLRAGHGGILTAVRVQRVKARPTRPLHSHAGSL